MHSRHPLTPPVEYVPIAQALQLSLLFWLLNVPAGQGMHSGLPASEKYPREHVPHTDAPDGENWPGWQALQFDADIAPSAVENFPASHLVQFASYAWPVPVPYLPVPQLTHMDPPVPSRYFPATHELQALAKPTAKVPAAQIVQLLAPPVATVPSGHASHVWAPLIFAGKEYLPIPHTSHVLFRPSMVEAVPSAHNSQSTSDVFEHALQPGIRLYFPAEHRMQGPPVEGENGSDFRV